MTDVATNWSSTEPAAFLRDYLQQLTPLFTEGLPTPALIPSLREKMHALRFRIPPESPLQAFLLAGCQSLSKLGPTSLSHFLALNSLPFAHFLSEPPAFFDCVLVPASHDAGGSGYICYFEDSLSPADIYYLLAHVYGHLLLGHLRKGDIYSHYDLLSDLRAPSGPRRRWDQAVSELQSLWFQPLINQNDLSKEIEAVEWHMDGFAEAFERFQQNRVDDMAVVIRAAAAHYGSHLLQVDFDLERDAQLFPHQKRGAVELAVRLQKLGVALLADSVGLGKTRTTATLIKLFHQYGIIQQAAVITPSKLEHNWLAELQKLRLRVGYPGDAQVDVILVNKDKFKRLDTVQAHQQVHGCGLLVVEEAHQDMRNMGNKFHRNIRDAAAGKYGLLVTATPWNNRRGDIFAMLQPFASTNLGTERPAQAFRCFAKGQKIGQKEFEQDNEIFRQVYNLTTIQRTRRQLHESGDSGVFYAPRRPYLISVPYTSEQRQAFATLLNHIEELRLPHFNPVRYLTASDTAEHRLSGIHRFVLLKRAESSMYAFSRSLDTLLTKTEAMRKSLENVADSDAAISGWLRQWYKLEEPIDDGFDLEATTEVLPPPRMRSARIQHLIEHAKRTGQLRSLRSTLLDDCSHDVRMVQTIMRTFQTLFAEDPKLEAILAQVNDSIAAGHKVLCISQFADTAHAVYQHLLKQPLLCQKGIGLVVSSSKGTQNPTEINGLFTSREEILSRFAPNSWNGNVKGKSQKNSGYQQLPATIDIVVGSDTLSVGQNLQDARVLINLDLCWNPMLHEQRIGRIDRPRHESDSAPLDILYFLNLDLIESEIRLRETIEKRLTAAYRDTAFDDEILPGYFDMIEQFRQLRRDQEKDKVYVDEVNTMLENIAERSARPPDLPLLNDELERAAVLRLQDTVQALGDEGGESEVNKLLVSVGRIPLFDQQQRLRPRIPEAALATEVAFQPIDEQKQPLGKTAYRHYYLALHRRQEHDVSAWDVEEETMSLVPLVDSLLAEPTSTSFFLHKQHITQLQMLLRMVEGSIQQELEVQRTILKRIKRYRGLAESEPSAEEKAASGIDDQLATTVIARLINVRFLV